MFVIYSVIVLLNLSVILASYFDDINCDYIKENKFYAIFRIDSITLYSVCFIVKLLEFSIFYKYYKSEIWFYMI